MFLMRKQLFGVGCVFYDKYPFLESTGAAPMFSSCSAKFLETLGWKLAVFGDKAEDFSSSFIVEVDLSSLHLEVLSLSNKPGKTQCMVDKKHELQVWSAYFNIRQVCRLAFRFGYLAVLSVQLNGSVKILQLARNFLGPV